MKIILCDIDPNLVDEWNKYFSVLPESGYTDHEVTVIHGSIFSLEVDAIVSPANSFGFMDGGIDYLISELLGWDIQTKLQQYIKEELDGELVVGNAAVISTTNKTVPFVISAPTMRVPMVLGSNSINTYLATRAALVAAKRSKLNSIAFPGMGTGVGEVPFDLCAHQMRQAYLDVFYPKAPSTWREAQRNHLQLLRI